MDVSGERAEGSFVSHEAVDEDAEELSAAVGLRPMLEVFCIIVVGGGEGLGG